MFNLYREPMWQDERYVTAKINDKRMRILTISKSQRSAREVETIYFK